MPDLVKTALAECADELEFFNAYVDKGLLERLRFVAERPFARVSYTEAVDILLQCGRTFEFPVVLVGLQFARVVTPGQLLKFWRYALILITVASAVLTPSGDPLSMMAMMIPLLFF